MMGDKLETYALQKWQTPEKDSQFAFDWFHQRYYTQGGIYLLRSIYWEDLREKFKMGCIYLEDVRETPNWKKEESFQIC